MLFGEMKNTTITELYYAKAVVEINMVSGLVIYFIWDQHHANKSQNGLNKFNPFE